MSLGAVMMVTSVRTPADVQLHGPKHPLPLCSFASSWDHAIIEKGHDNGGGVNGCPSASDSATKMRVAGDMQSIVFGSSASVLLTVQSPAGMSLFVIVITVVSVVVSWKTLVLKPGISPVCPNHPSMHPAA